MNGTNAKQLRINRVKSGGKQLLSPEQQPKTQTSSQNVIKKDDARPMPAPKIKQESPIKTNNNKDLLPCQSKEKIKSQLQSSISSSLQGSDLEREDILKMEIKQLKRQNQFLRRKIQELTQEQQQTQHHRKKTTTNKAQTPKSAVDSLHLSVNYFFKEIGGLLNSVARLFSLDTSTFPKLQSSQALDIETCQCPAEKYHLFKSHVLSKKIEKILLEQERFKYPMLVELFRDYYRYKQQAELKIMTSLQEMIEKANQLNKWLLEKAQIKKMKSDAFSSSQKETIVASGKEFHLDFLKTPQTNQTTRSTYSPAPKNVQNYVRKIDHSPK